MQFYSTYKGSQYINICKVYEERFTSSKSGLDLASEHLIIIVFLTKKHHGGKTVESVAS